MLLKLMSKMRFRWTSVSHQCQSVRSLPICSVQTNLSLSAVPSDFTRRLCQLLASTLDKPQDVSDSNVLFRISAFKKYLSLEDSLFESGRAMGAFIVHFWNE